MKNCCQILVVLWSTVSDGWTILVEEIPESRRKLTSKNKAEMKMQSARTKGLLDLQDTLAAGDHPQLRRASGIQSKRHKMSKQSKKAVFASEASKHGLTKAEGVAAIAKLLRTMRSKRSMISAYSLKRSTS
eukprot:jgi/Ulvmu1/910/UM101_0019.1